VERQSGPGTIAVLDGYYDPPIKTIVIRPDGEGKLHTYTHEFCHHASIDRYPDKLETLVRMLGWKPASGGQWAFHGDPRNFPTDYSRYNPFEHVAELMSFYIEDRAVWRKQFTPDVCQFMDDWIAQG